MNSFNEMTNPEGVVGWQAPSNIALVKYWGKYGEQLPCNPSLSFTLTDSFTKTVVKWQKCPANQSKDEGLEFYFEGKKEASFQKRVQSYIDTLMNSEMPFLKELQLCINTENSFPHSTGIASSASSMASLALCLCELEGKLTDKPIAGVEFFTRASHIARLGSGSACRSLFPMMAWWGKHQDYANSSNGHAICISKMANVFKEFNDSILIISSEKKSVSSSAGHQLMEEHPMANVRFQNAYRNCYLLSQLIEKGEDLYTFGELVEKEALELHALMMTSTPSFILMKPASLAVIEKIRGFRAKESLPVFFTLDAGPNIHLLYPNHIKDKVLSFIENSLKEHLEDERVIHDKVGNGPINLYE